MVYEEMIKELMLNNLNDREMQVLIKIAKADEAEVIKEFGENKKGIYKNFVKACINREAEFAIN